MKNLRQYVPLVIAGLIALCIGTWFGTARLHFDSNPSTETLWTAQFNDLQGRPVAMGSLKGQPVVINFWATWCGPCKEEMPDFQRLAQSDIGKNARIVGIGIDNAINMQTFANQLGITYTLLEGGPRGLDLMKALGNQVGGLPFTLVVDTKGGVVLQRLGRVSYEELRSAVIAAKM